MMEEIVRASGFIASIIAIAAALARCLRSKARP